MRSQIRFPLVGAALLIADVAAFLQAAARDEVEDYLYLIGALITSLVWLMIQPPGHFRR